MNLFTGLDVTRMQELRNYLPSAMTTRNAPLQPKYFHPEQETQTVSVTASQKLKEAERKRNMLTDTD